MLDGIVPVGKVPVIRLELTLNNVNAIIYPIVDGIDPEISFKRRSIDVTCM